jgi:hypothetical protein
MIPCKLTTKNDKVFFGVWGGKGTPEDSPAF